MDDILVKWTVSYCFHTIVTDCNLQFVYAMKFQLENVMQYEIIYYSKTMSNKVVIWPRYPQLLQLI